MNKVFNINLGGYPFTIDENAYHHLKQYLSAIDSHFKNSDGFDDITTDIEARLAEIFSETLQGRQIVMLKDVQGAINIMGTPEDFGAESNYSAIPEEEKEEASEEANEGIFKKKMQRFGKMKIIVQIEDKKPRAIKIQGNAIVVFKTEIEI